MESSSNFHTYQKCFQYFSDTIAWRVYILKSKLLESEENKIDEIEGRTMEEKTTNIIKWFMHKDVSEKSKSSTSFDSKVVDTSQATKYEKQMYQQE